MITINTIKSTLLATTITILLSACGSSSSNNESPNNESSKATPPPPVAFDYQALIDNNISADVPGIILLVNTPEREFIGSAGVSDIENQTPIETTDTFHIASSGKVFTALLAAQLHEEGILNLDDTLSTWLPADLLNQIQYSEQITLRQLLNHTSGIYNYSDENTYVDEVLENPDVQRDNFYLTSHALNKPAYFEPGTSVRYSNTNYTLAGMILDSALGYPNAIEMRDRIITPLSLDATFSVGYENGWVEMIPGYEVLHGQQINTGPLLANFTVASTPVASSVADLAHFTKSLFKDTNFISDDIHQLMWGDDSLTLKEPNNYFALGLEKYTGNGNTIYHHDGANHGYLTQNIYIENKDISIVFFLNCGLSDECTSTFESIKDKVLSEAIK